MKKEEQRQFIRKLIKTVKKDILEETKKYPDNWDGHELRERIKDHFELCSWDSMSRSRKRSYINYKRVNGLIG